jgi:pantothenate kinase
MEVEGQSLKFYVTDKLRPSATVVEDDNIKSLKGFPLGFEMTIEGMTLRVTAIDVIKQVVESDAFEIPESYEMKTLDEFVEEVKAKSKGMGGGDIGL